MPTDQSLVLHLEPADRELLVAIAQALVSIATALARLAVVYAPLHSPVGGSWEQRERVGAPYPAPEERPGSRKP